MKKEQQHIFDVLESLHFEFMIVDIAACDNEPVKEFLRKNSPCQLRLPQIWVGGEFRASYEEFYEAVEEGQLAELLRPNSADLPDEPLH